MKKDNKSEKTLRLFEVGYNCSQSVLITYSSELGLSEDLALRIAAPFGGGIGHMGEVCGAVSGAMMVLGLRNGFTNPDDKNAYKVRAGKVGGYLKYFNERDLDYLNKEIAEKLSDRFYFYK